MLPPSRSKLPRILAAVPKTKTDPNSLLPEPVVEAGAGLREEPVRGRAGEEGTRQESQPLGNSGELATHLGQTGFF